MVASQRAVVRRSTGGMAFVRDADSATLRARARPDADSGPDLPEGPPPPPAVQRLRVRYAKRGRLRFASARDFQRAFERALRRAAVPMAYSAGFTPHPSLLRGRGADRGGERGGVPRDRGHAAAATRSGCARRWTPSLPAGLDVLEVVEARDGQAGRPAGGLVWECDLPGMSTPDAEARPRSGVSWRGRGRGAAADQERPAHLRRPAGGGVRRCVRPGEPRLAEAGRTAVCDTATGRAACDTCCSTRRRPFRTRPGCRPGAAVTARGRPGWRRGRLHESDGNGGRSAGAATGTSPALRSARRAAMLATQPAPSDGRTRPTSVGADKAARARDDSSRVALLRTGEHDRDRLASACSRERPEPTRRHGGRRCPTYQHHLLTPPQSTTAAATSRRRHHGGDEPRSRPAGPRTTAPAPDAVGQSAGAPAVAAPVRSAEAPRRQSPSGPGARRRRPLHRLTEPSATPTRSGAERRGTGSRAERRRRAQLQRSRGTTAGLTRQTAAKAESNRGRGQPAAKTAVPETAVPEAAVSGRRRPGSRAAHAVTLRRCSSAPEHCHAAAEAAAQPTPEMRPTARWPDPPEAAASAGLAVGATTSARYRAADAERSAGRAASRALTPRGAGRPVAEPADEEEAGDPDEVPDAADRRRRARPRRPGRRARARADDGRRRGRRRRATTAGEGAVTGA